ncbi:hypothetical protein ACHAWF_018268 [Thalassiosira exigua]
MAASLRPVRLPLPAAEGGGRGPNCPDDEGGDGGGGEVGGAVRGWDRSIATDASSLALEDDLLLPPDRGGGRDSNLRRSRPDPGASSSSSSRSVRPGRTATFAAAAVGRCVVGVDPGPPGDDDDGDGCERRRSWRTSLDGDGDGRGGGLGSGGGLGLGLGLGGGGGGPVLALASNASRTAIAAATSTHATLLRGRDGGVLASRRIAADGDDRRGGRGVGGGGIGEEGSPPPPPPRLLFLSDDDDGGNDLLIIACPPSASPSSSSSSSNVVVIGGIDGRLLNSSDPREAREGAARMTVGALPLPDGGDGGDDDGGANRRGGGAATWIEGTFVAPHVARLFVERRRGEDGSSGATLLSVCDYDATEKASRSILEDLGGHLERSFGAKGKRGGDDDGSNDDEDDEDDDGDGIEPEWSLLGVDSHDPSRAPLLLLSRSRGGGGGGGGGGEGTGPTVAWVDVGDLSVRARCDVPRPGATIASCAPLRVRDEAAEGGCVAAAAALSDRATGKREVLVMQAAVVAREERGEAGGAKGEFEEGEAAALFSIDLGSASGSGRDDAEVFAPEPSARRDPYVFRALVRGTSADGDGGDGGEGGGGGVVVRCLEFDPGASGARAGTVHALLARGDGEGARALAEELDELERDEVRRRRGDAPSSSSGGVPSVGFEVATLLDPTAVTLRRFRRLLSSSDGASTDEGRSAARDCLRRLAGGAVEAGRDGRRGAEGLAAAADLLMGWPACRAGRRGGVDDSDGVAIQEVSAALSAMSSAVRGVVDAAGSSPSTRILEERRVRLDDRLASLAALRAAVPSVDSASLTPGDPYLATSSVPALLRLLASDGMFRSVEKLGRRLSRDLGSTSVCPIAGPPRAEALAAAALAIPCEADPREYVPWLRDVVLPSLATGHPALGRIRRWGCAVADRHDGADGDVGEGMGLDASVRVLTAIAEATARLTVASGGCFAYPLQAGVTREPDESLPFTPRDGASASFSFVSRTSSFCSSRPTVLGVGMTGGARRRGDRSVRSGRDVGAGSPCDASLDLSFFSMSSSSPNSTADTSFFDGDDDEEDDERDCVEEKLAQALRLRRARALGLGRERLVLAEYASAGEAYVAKELVRSALDRTSTTKVGLDAEIQSVVEEVRTFAAEVGADFDEAVLSCMEEIRDGASADRSLGRTVTLAGWCVAPPARCRAALIALRAALASARRPPDLSALAREAIDAAADDAMRSELEEARRLLTIDALVRKYVGNGAQEFFRASDPSHGRKLVRHVCRHVDAPGALADAMTLCDAFGHVDRLDACVDLLQRTADAPERGAGGGDGRAGQCAARVRELCARNVALAERVVERAAGYCAEVLEDCRNMNRRRTFLEEAQERAVRAANAACAMLSAVWKRSSARRQKAAGMRAVGTVEGLLGEFQKVSKLQSGCGIFLTLRELRDPSHRTSVVCDLLEPCVRLLLSPEGATVGPGDDGPLRDALRSLANAARRWCATLCDSPLEADRLWSDAVRSVASRLAQTSANHASLLMLDVSGLLDERGENCFHAIMSGVQALIERAFSEAKILSGSITIVSRQDKDSLEVAMRCMAIASFLLREHILPHAPTVSLPASLSLGDLAEIVCEILTRADMGFGERLERYIRTLEATSRGHRRWSSGLILGRVGACTNNRIPPPPILHPDWYIGDGLNLQPIEALLLSTSYCRMVMEAESGTSHRRDQGLGESTSGSDIVHALESRGAHSTSLRVLLLSTTVSLSQGPSASVFLGAGDLLKRNNCVLAERSLGGTASGLTSGVVDALLSASFLMHLPKEMSFKVYQAALPSAVGKRDFCRLQTLAGIGIYCGIGSFLSGEKFPWSKQRRLIEQCKELYRNAIWWEILSHYGVCFDPSTFSQRRDSKSSVEREMHGFCEMLIRGASLKLGPRITLDLARKFAKDYGLNKYIPPSSLIEFLLSVPDAAATSADPEQLEANSEDQLFICGAFDIRQDLNHTEAAVRECLAILPTLNRSVVLRKCVMKLEKDDNSAKDYDRHALLLELYRECLNKLSGVMKKSDARAKAHEEETDRIDRRASALVIMSSIFEKRLLEKRPEYTKLFEPLPRDHSHPIKDERKFGVIGIGTAKDGFDPLAPLDEVLEDENVAAVAPLCNLLQLPSGYLHARSLVVRFRKLKANGGSLPPFSLAVVPVAKKLKSLGDKADLAWWCSLQYDAGSVEQLKCLDLAYVSANEASEEAEASNDRKEEIAALERLKRIDAARAGLSDKILVDEVIKRHESAASPVKVLYKLIIDRVQQRAQADSRYCPEYLVQALLFEGSQTAAVASLDDTDGFSTHHFRMLALLVHDACKSLSNRYSHVNVGKCARILTRRWLVHGDDSEDGINISDATSVDETDNGSREPTEIREKSAEESEDTSEFVMDFGIISSGNRNWSQESKKAGDSEVGITSSEEPSALKSLSSREKSEQLCSRVALRIAFLICFAEDYHCQSSSSPEKGNENLDSNVPSKNQRQRSKSKANRRSTNCFEGNLALQHAQELLRIVFAGQGSTIASAYGFLFDESTAYNGSILSSLPEESVKEEFHAKSKAVSFAMRHRALRVATILCPQELIVRVVAEYTYSGEIGDDILNRCAFASFVAMEIEAMGLPLPHSDLVQCSRMHFPSYARTIWRNHGGSSSRRNCGRLHLLLLDLCVYHHSTVDWELFLLIFNELKRMELPRSLLLSCECSIQSGAIALAASEMRADVMQAIGDATMLIGDITVSEVETNLGAGIEFDASECSSTLHRLTSVITTEYTHADPARFVDIFSNLSKRCEEQGEKEIGSIFIDAAITIANHLTDPEAFHKVSSIIASTTGERESIMCKLSDSQQLQHSVKSVCREAIQKFERSFH